jgi:hypothetical protein
VYSIIHLKYCIEEYAVLLLLVVLGCAGTTVKCLDSASKEMEIPKADEKKFLF